jgi:hypothetical protein
MNSATSTLYHWKESQSGEECVYDYVQTLACQSILKGFDNGVLHSEESCFWTLSIV